MSFLLKFTNKHQEEDESPKENFRFDFEGGPRLLGKFIAVIKAGRDKACRNFRHGLSPGTKRDADEV